MANASNTISLIGHAADAPEVQTTKGGTTIAKFRLAVDRGRKDVQGNKQSDWFTVKAYGKTAEIASEYVSKGKHLAVVGSMVNEQYEKEGAKRDYWVVQADALRLLSDGAPAGRRAAPADEEIPF